MKKKLFVILMSITMIVTMMQLQVFANAANDEAEKTIFDETKEENSTGDCLFLKAVGGDVQFRMIKEHNAPDVKYQVKQGQSWKIFTPGETVITIPENTVVSFRAASETQAFPSNEYGQNVFVMDPKGGNGKIEASGNIMSLVSQDGSEMSVDDYGFMQLFKDCKILTKAPELPATELGMHCYTEMFKNCIGITKTPGLNATELNEYCYQNMFEGCTGLNEAPSLPAEELMDFCYLAMFKGCESLVQAPKLIGKKMTQGCYMKMFEGCISLTEAPELFSIELSKMCYCEMFSGCTSLTKAPVLPANTLCEECYKGMFKGCTSLTEAPDLPAKKLVHDCYSTMFSGCNNLSKIKVSFVDWDEEENVATGDWLKDVAKEGTFMCPPELETSKRDVDHILGNWQINNSADCLGFKAIDGDVKLSMGAHYTNPHNLRYKYLSPENVWEEFNPYETVITIPEGKTIYFRAAEESQEFPAYMNGGWNFKMDNEGGNGKIEASGSVMSLAGSDYSRESVDEFGFAKLFLNCNILTKAPELPATKLGRYCYDEMFSGCSALTEAPYLPSQELSEACYLGMFMDCSALEEAPSLPVTTLSEECYQEMFSGCENLVNAPELPATKLQRGCYWNMFTGCKNLIKAPDLLAPKLEDLCYYEMFKDCKKLDYINVGFTQWYYDATENWLSGVAEVGYFDCSEEIDRTSRGPSGIPEKWIIVDCLKFKAVDGDVKLGMEKEGQAPAVTYEYSEDRIIWKEFIPGESNVTIKKDSKIYFRAAKDTQNFPGSSDGYLRFIMSQEGGNGKIEAEGDIISLVSKYCVLTEMQNYAFYNLFGNCTCLTKGPRLTAAKLTEFCYARIFEGCSSLNNVTVGFNQWNDEGHSTDNWLSGVAKDGKFFGHGHAEIDKRDENHVPEEWAAPEDYLSFKAVESDAVIHMQESTGDPWYFLRYKYSFDKEKWKGFRPGQSGTYVTIPKGKIVYFRVDEEWEGSFPCTYEDYWKIKPVGKVEAGGNIMSLVYTDCSGTHVTWAGFSHLFQGYPDLIKAPKLPATSLEEGAYADMFKGTGLTEAPELPATGLEAQAYAEMFKDCKNLKKVPKLSAASTEFDNNYVDMFSGCSSLSFINCGLTHWSGTDNWLAGVAENGTFICPPELDQSIRDASHIPPGWNINSATIKFNSTAEEGSSGGYYDENGNAIENLDLSTGTTFTVTDEEKTGDKVITFTYPDSTVKKVYVKPGEGSEIKTFTPPASPIEANCEFNTTFGVKTYNVSLTSAEGSIGTGKYYNDETEISSIRVPNNTAVTAEKIDDKTVQINFDNVALITAKADEGSVIEEFAAPESPIKSDCTFSAKFMKEIHTVTFDVQGHGTAPDAQSVNYGESVQKPEDPSEEGYTFGGWYTEKECQNEFDFATPITADTTLYAKWTINTYTVTFDVQGHGTAPDAQTVNYSDKAQKPDDPSEEGYRFDGWYQESGCENEFDFDTPIKADTTLYAKWTKAFTVTFDMNGHGTKPSDQQVAEGELAEEPESPTEEGYTFGGWYTEKECQNEFDFDTPITANTTLYAKWTINTYTVTFDVQGHGTAPDAQSVDYNDKAQKPADPSEEGYTFGGWYTEKECENEFNFDTPIKADTTLYAKWTINTYTVTFDVQGHGTAPDAQTVNYSDKAERPADPSEEGYRFDGWYQESGCENEFDFDTPIKADTTLYAKWTKIFTVTFDMNDHGTKPSDQQVAEGELAEEPESPTEEGYTFGGWYTEKECQNEFDFDTPITANTTLYAKWTINTYTVTFDIQGHGTSPDAQSVNYGDKAQKPADLRERGYTFGGWYDNEECKGTQFDFNTPIKADTTIYARWTKVIVPEIKGFSVEVTDSKTVSVKWNKITGFDGITYELWRREGTSGAFKLVTQGTSNTYKDTKVKTDTKYYYKVRTIRTAQGYTYKGKFCKSDYAYPRLYQVTKLSAIALNAADVQLKWNANGNKNVVYQVYRSTKSDTGFAKVGTITDSKTSFSQSFTPEQSGRKYYYKVRAITKDYTGKWHYGTFSKVDYAYPRVHAVAGFKAWAPNAKCAKVYFKPLPNQNTKYWLYKSTKPTGDFGSPIAKLSYKENLYTDKKVKAGHKYYYMLRPVEVINGKTYFGPYTNVEYAYPR